ncbi:MAG: asparagine synthase (glutamine-hydrolyzing) [Pseudomonadota bacterium]
MCAVNGIYAYHRSAPHVDPVEAATTRDAMTRRGPDDCGLWESADHRLVLGHRRLSIIDLSEAGRQPMVSGCGRYVLCFNGEIFNYGELREELTADGERFRSSSDSEVLLKLLSRHGSDALRRLRGMFALAFWDQQTRELLLARDHFGIKPLYVADDGWQLRFASQVKALLTSRAVSRELDPAGQAGFLLTGSIPEPFTLYRAIRPLPAGHYQRCGPTGPAAPVSFVKEPSNAKENRPADLKAAVEDSIRAHLVADVPVGVFLSAGIDSAVLAALASRQNPKLEALTVGFAEYRNSDRDEVTLARQIAGRLGVHHQVSYYAREQFERDLPQVLSAMDQPSIDGLNTWIVAGAAAKAGWKTALSGLGADELFAGYPSFSDVPRWHRQASWASWVPGLGRLLRTALRPICSVLGLSPKAAGMLEYGRSLGGAYLLKRGLFMPWELPELMGRPAAREGLRRLNLVGRMDQQAGRESHPAAAVSALEQGFYLKNQLLRDADWAGMSHSLEIRVPYVDTSLQQLAGGVRFNKNDLLRTAADLLPQMLFERPKTGFTTPLDQWRGHPGAGWARHWAQELQCRF